MPTFSPAGFELDTFKFRIHRQTGLANGNNYGRVGLSVISHFIVCLQDEVHDSHATLFTTAGPFSIKLGLMNKRTVMRLGIRWHAFGVQQAQHFTLLGILLCSLGL